MVHEAYVKWRDSLATGENIEESSEVFFRALRDLAQAVVFTTLHRHDPQLEADIVTKAFLKAKNFNDLSSFGTWFWRLGFNMCISDWRAKRRRKEVFLDDLLEEPVQPARTGGEFIERFASLREHLTREDLKMIDLRLEGNSLTEIAKLLGVELREVSKRWEQCKRHAKKFLESPDERK